MSAERSPLAAPRGASQPILLPGWKKPLCTPRTAPSRRRGENVARGLVLAFLVAAFVLPSAAGASPFVGRDADACTLQAGGGPSPVACRLRHDVTLSAEGCIGNFCTYTVDSLVVADADVAGLLAIRTTVDDGSSPGLGACVGPEALTDLMDRASPVPCGQDCSDTTFGTTLTCRSVRTHAVHLVAGECVLVLVHATLVYDEVVAVAGTYLPFRFCR